MEQVKARALARLELAAVGIGPNSPKMVLLLTDIRNLLIGYEIGETKRLLKAVALVATKKPTELTYPASEQAREKAYEWAKKHGIWATQQAHALGLSEYSYANFLEFMTKRRKEFPADLVNSILD